MFLTKQQRLEKILSILESYKPHKNALLSKICRVCRINKANLYYYEDRRIAGFEVVCTKCVHNYKANLRFKLSTQDKFLLEISL